MIRPLLALSAAALAAVAAPAASPADRDRAELDRFLAKAEAQPPVDCLNLNRGNIHSQIIDETTIVYRQGARLRWINKIPGGCPSLRYDRAIVTRTPINRLCRGDIFTVIDPPMPVSYGSCTFGEFTPYKRR